MMVAACRAADEGKKGVQREGNGKGLLFWPNHMGAHRRQGWALRRLVGAGRFEAPSFIAHVPPDG